VGRITVPRDCSIEMMASQDIVITGMGVVCPIGVGSAAVAHALATGQSGVRRMPLYDSPDFAVRMAAGVVDFDAKQYVTPRKSLKVMSRNIQLAFGAAQMAVDQASIASSGVSPERLGVVFGSDMIQVEPEELVNAFRQCIVDGKFNYGAWDERAISEMYPLWMLKYLPNMPACHIGIAQDARGPNNTIVLAEASSLLAIAEAMRVIERGAADMMIVGGAGSRMHPLSWTFRDNRLHSRRHESPEQASRPFELHRDGMVYGEGAASFVLETRQHAQARGAKILAQILGFASSFEACTPGQPFSGAAIRTAIRNSLQIASLKPSEVGHVNAHGLSTIDHDRAEALAIRDTVGDAPVTALKSYFGNLGAGGGAVEMVGSMLALESGEVPATLNYDQPDPECPIHVVHGQPHKTAQRTALVLNQTCMGQSVAMVLGAD